MASPPQHNSTNGGGGGGGGGDDIHRQQTVDNEVFPRFDVVSDSSDHHYANSNTIKSKKNGGDCFTNMTSGVHKKIMQEWRILEKHLPDSVYVRVYENRIDLLRSVIVGAAGTPYHDGLYFFDIAFPSDYPARPPMVYYRSYGLRLNPNLYATGRVCLSLINTWPGKKSEKWNPNESTVLQVLVSIQALVLNEKPYFNEPGYGMWPGRVIWEKKSNAYNEDVFVLSCKTMLFLLRRPPKNFEGFVSQHFKDRATSILSACNAYANGQVRVGYYRDDNHENGSSSSSSSAIDPSGKFKGLVRQLYPDLLVALTRTGASVGDFFQAMKAEKKTPPMAETAVVKKKKKNDGVWGKLKKVLGLKKEKKSSNGKSSSVVKIAS